MKIIILYFEDDNAHMEDAPQFFAKSDSIENAEAELGKLERFIKGGVGNAL